MLALVGDSVTTDHISPAGSIAPRSPAGKYLQEHGVEPQDFNSYGSRRGNHEVMMRGTFANIRLRNKLADGKEGGWTAHIPSGEVDADLRRRDEVRRRRAPRLIILAGKEYGSGSSRDWAAKGPRLQGVKAVIAESFERIHRSNLVGMGVLPLQFTDGENAESLGLNGRRPTTSPASPTGSSRTPNSRSSPRRTTARRRRSRSNAASTRRSSSTTTATAECSRWSSEGCWHREEPRRSESGGSCVKL